MLQMINQFVNKFVEVIEGSGSQVKGLITFDTGRILIEHIDEKCRAES